MGKRQLTPRSILMLLCEARVLEVARAVEVDGPAFSFGGALSAIESHSVPARRILDALTDHELHFLCVRQSVVPDPRCPREQLIGFLLGESELTCGAFYLGSSGPRGEQVAQPSTPGIDPPKSQVR